MTSSQAVLESKKRWGPQGAIGRGPDGCAVGRLAFSKRRWPQWFLKVHGRGDSWEAAFAAADRHPKPLSR